METKITFNTGYTLEFRPISRAKIAKISLAIEAKFRSNNEPLDPPQYYTVEPTENDPGIKEDHNETTLITDEDKKLWALHLNAKDRLLREQELKTFRYVLTKGIATDIKPSQEWIDENKELGISLPNDPDDLYLEYLYEEVLISQHNIGLAVSRPLMLGIEGLVPDEEVSAMEDTFRGNVESRNNTKEISPTSRST